MCARVVWRVVLLRVPVSQLIGNIQKSGARTPVHTTRPRHFFNSACKDPFWDYYLGFEREREICFFVFFEHLFSVNPLFSSVICFFIRFPPKKKQNKKEKKGGVCTKRLFVPDAFIIYYSYTSEGRRNAETGRVVFTHRAGAEERVRG